MPKKNEMMNHKTLLEQIDLALEVFFVEAKRCHSSSLACDPIAEHMYS